MSVAKTQDAAARSNRDYTKIVPTQHSNDKLE